VLIYGAGTMGLMMLELAKATGASSVHVVDPNTDRLATAKQLGITAAAGTADEFEIPRGWDVVIDASGDALAIQDGIGRVGRGGTFLQFGVADYKTRAIIEPYLIYNREITITGSMAVLHSFERASDLFANGLIDPDVFISDRMALEDFSLALERFASGKSRKIQVRP
jgi:threonine dehydrogenase-like Zn-dependent dehydrogenase